MSSITHVVNASANTLATEYSYNACLSRTEERGREGRMRNPTTWVNYAPGQEPDLTFAGRGFTGHSLSRFGGKHLPWCNLINMNGRVYDPLVGQFLSPDNHVQYPYFSQSLNRYSYCVNNPLIYTDPSGEKWWHWLLGKVLTGGMVSMTAAVTGTTVSAMATTIASTSAITYMAANTTLHSMILPIQQSAMISDYTMGAFYNATHAGDVPDRLGNAFKIDVGYLFSIPGWEDTQSLLGNTVSHLRNLTGNVDNVEIDWDRMTVLVNDVNPKKNALGGLTGWGMTLGPYINGQNMELNDDMYRHEAGHTIQSRFLGPFYTQNIGLSSLMSATFGDSEYHSNSWYEVWANRLGGAPDIDKYPRYYRYDNFWYWFPAIVLPFFPY